MKIIDEKFMNELIAKAAESPRLRSHFNLHATLDEGVHRLVMAGVKGTYIRPHRHFSTQKYELFTILKGRGCVLTFNSRGVVTQRCELVAGGANTLVELAPDEWHTFFPLSNEVVVCEVKAGPYIPTPEEDFASWSPSEGEEEANHFVRWFTVAGEGEEAPNWSVTH